MNNRKPCLIDFLSVLSSDKMDKEKADLDLESTTIDDAFRLELTLAWYQYQLSKAIACKRKLIKTLQAQ